MYSTVYDCGSYLKPFVIEEISSFFNQGDKVDILFISHFDNDHISGLNELKKVCTIKTVVMPLINSVQKMYMLSQGVDRLFITNPESYFSGARIVYVSPYGDIDDNGRNQTGVLYSNLPAKIESARHILMSVNTCWVYIPFNYDSISRQQYFTTLLKDIEELNDLDFNDDTQVNDLIRNADRKLIGKINKVFKCALTDGANKISMILYSGPLSIPQSRPYYIIEGESHLTSSEVAALYMGDTDLHQNDIIPNLKSHLKERDVNIGLVQLPHHGSRKNFIKDLLGIGNSYSPRLYFASYGTSNRYGHPSYAVIQDVIVACHKFIPVTEKRDSVLIQTIIK